jgi:hypothetical protein
MSSLPTTSAVSTSRSSKRRVGPFIAVTIGLAAGLEFIATAHPSEDVKLYARAAYITIGGMLVALGFQRS